MASFCYVCGTATPTGVDRATGQRLVLGASAGISPDDLLRRLQRALGPGYEIEERVGAGGFAVVYRVRDLRLKRDLAVKVLRPDLGLSPDMLQRFRREAETVAALRHANIVPIYDVGEAEGIAFLIMPLIAGESLRATLEREGAMPPATAARILREAASGLAAAHDAGVIHRDIKPENIMLEGPGRHALLMDFGIAKAVSPDEGGDPALTGTGIIIGTPQYMSPEQATGERSLDPRTDQYSLGVVAYRMVSGALPFRGDSTRAVLYQQMVADPEPLAQHVPEIPTALATAIQRAMAKDPADRFPSMRDFAAALEHSPGPGAHGQAAVIRSKRSAALVAVGLGLTLLAGGTFWATRSTPAVDPGVDSIPQIDDTTALAPAGVLAEVAIDPSPGRATRPTAGGSPSPVSQPATTAPPANPTPAALSCARASETEAWSAALTACTQEATGGDATSQRLLGVLYNRGQGVTEDPVLAAEWFRKAASTDAEAKYQLAMLLESGRGVTRNTAEAILLIRESAALGLLSAQRLLASRLASGFGIRKDETEAASWYRRLAERGDREGQLTYAELLARGRGTAKDEAAALDWYRKAADQGSAEAGWQAAQMYFKGRGTAKDEPEGMVWLRRAAEASHPEAVKELRKRGG